MTFGAPNLSLHVKMPRLAISWLLLCLLLVLSSADTSTTVVSVTSTTTVHVTATDYTGACENFVGACVVYGTYGNAPYTTTVYVGQQSPPPPPPPPPTVTTSTTTIVATTTASNSDACSGFVGACVVYATNSRNAPQSTVYYAGSSNAPRPGNNQGYIGSGQGDSQGYIGGAPRIKLSSTAFAFGLLGALILTLRL